LVQDSRLLLHETERRRRRGGVNDALHHTKPRGKGANSAGERHLQRANAKTKLGYSQTAGE